MTDLTTGAGEIQTAGAPMNWGHCKDCKWWKAGYGKDDEFRYCKRVGEEPDFRDGEPKGIPAFYLEPSGDEESGYESPGSLVTHKDFGCVQFEARDRVTA